MIGAHVVIDVSNAPSFDPREASEFFQTSGRNLIAAEATAGVRHHVTLSILPTPACARTSVSIWPPVRGCRGLMREGLAI
jgi:hypothetical protein